MTQEKNEIYNAILQVVKYEALTAHYCERQQYFFVDRFYKKLLENLTYAIESLHMYEDEDGDCLQKDSLYLVYQEIRRSYENTDYMQLADILRNDLEPMIYKIQAHLLGGEMLAVDEERLKKNLLAMTKVYPLLEKSLFGEKISSDYENDGILSEEHYQLVITAIQENFERGYEIGYADSGEIIINYKEGDYLHRLHSFQNPSKEATELAAEWMKDGDDRFVCYGFGMGYVYEKILEMNDMAEIFVIDGSRSVITLAVVFSDLWKLYETGRFKILPDSTNLQMFQQINQMDAGKTCKVYGPSLVTIENVAFRQKMEEYFIQESSVRTQSHQLMGNFRRNQKLHSDSAFALKERFLGKDIYIVAAGPSLDKNLKELRNVGTEGIILATGTVLKKMVNAGIRPEYVIITDSGKGTYMQIQDFYDVTIPLIYLSTVYYKIPKDYPGAKYILYQKDFPLSEEVSLKKNIPLVETGGSVSTTALDFCCQMGCKRIVFLGLDLAYTDNRDHASDTAYVKTMTGEQGIFVKDIYGNKVQTGKNLNIYREWMEHYIQRKNEKKEIKIPIIDATEGGARIKGMEILALRDVVLSGKTKEMAQTASEKYISIIIPCYNVEKYVDRCMNTLVQQSIGIEHLELILVDDASTDHTMEHLKQWEKVYPESILIVACEKNGRQGTARNIGMQYASAPYIGFVDSDDWVEIDMYRALYQKAKETSVDVVCCQCYRDTGDGKEPSKMACQAVRNQVVTINTVQDRKKLLDKRMTPGVYSKLYRREFLIDNQIDFPEGLTYEDNYFSVMCNFAVKSYYVMDNAYYHYFSNLSSTVMVSDKMHHLDRLEIEKIKWDALMKKGYGKEYMDEIEFSFLKLYYVNTVHILFVRFSSLRLDVIEKMREEVLKRCPNFEENPYLQTAPQVIHMFLNTIRAKLTVEDWKQFGNVYRQNCGFGPFTNAPVLPNEKITEQEKSSENKEEQLLAKKKISIIIPCYNVEKEVDRCMNSLVRQTIGIENLELILVDDASTDSTLELLKKWEKRYPKSILIVECAQNGRQGAARNIGMQYASAPYIGFVDSDDWVEKDMFEKLYQKAEETKAEMVCCQCVRDLGDGATTIPMNCQCETEQLVDVVTIADRKKLLITRLTPGVYSKLYQTSFIKDNEIVFPEGLTYEDNYFSALCLFYLKKYYVLSDVLYHYYVNSKSTVRQIDVSHHLDRLSVEKMKWDTLSEKGFLKDYKEEMEYIFVKFYYLNSLHMIFTHYSHLLFDVICEMKKEVLHRCPNYKNNPYLAMDKLTVTDRSFLETLEKEMEEKDWMILAESHRKFCGLPAWK